MEEIWKDIIGYEGLYQISSLGRVKSLPRSWSFKHWQDGSIITPTSKERLLKPHVSKRGYYIVALSKGKGHIKNIHRLIAQAFIPNPKNLKVINHKDGNKLNNSIDNLEWCTQKENMQHAFNIGLVNTKKPVLQYDINGNYITTWDSAREAKKALKIKNIEKCCYRERKHAGNYIWRHKSDINKMGKENLEKEIKEISILILKQKARRLELKNKRENARPYRKAIIQYTLDGEYVQTWESAREINRQLGFCYKNIGNTCLGKQKMAYGYKWKFKEKEHEYE